MTNWAFNWLTFPSDYDADDPYYVQIPRALVEQLTGTLIAQWEKREPWDTEGDHEQGRQAAYLLQERLYTGLNMNTDIWLGSIKLWPLNSDPGDGWMLCDGRAINRATYADLYTLIGDTFGAGDGSTTFNLPNQAATSAGLYYIIKVSPL